MKKQSSKTHNNERNSSKSTSRGDNGRYMRRSSKRRQPKKDSDSVRVNFDNTRVSKFDKDVKLTTTEEGTRAANDIRWYSKNPQLLQASAGSVVFSSTTGQSIPYIWLMTIPGIMTLRWTPSIGPADIEAVKQAQESIYSYVVHANSRNQSYDSVDLMLMILGTAEVFSWIASGIRVYGTMKRFDGENYYTPQALVKAQGFDYNDLKAHQADMWYYLNQVIAQSAQLWIPKDLPFVERWFWLNSNIYRDSESAKGQMYMFVPDTPHIYNPTFNDKGGGLELLNNDKILNRYGSTPLKFADFVEITDKLLNALLQVQDRGIMLGDVLKAYGADNIYALSEIPSDYMTPLLYDREVLTQIENATCLEITPYTIGQTVDGYLTMTNAYAGHTKTEADAIELIHRSLPDHLMLNFHFDSQPTAADIMVATRLSAAGLKVEIDSSGMYKVFPETCGTEIVTAMIVYYYDTSGNTLRTSAHHTMEYQTFGDTSLPVEYVKEDVAEIKRLMFASAFDWAPLVYFGTSHVQEKNSKYYPKVVGQTGGVIGDLDNCIPIYVDVLRKLNNTALYSEFGVPKL